MPCSLGDILVWFCLYGRELSASNKHLLWNPIIGLFKFFVLHIGGNGCSLLCTEDMTKACSNIGLLLLSLVSGPIIVLWALYDGL